MDASTRKSDPNLQPKRGYINPRAVRAACFAVLTICILISVFACILAIWDLTKADTLWRTVATCIVVSSGMMAFGVINLLYGPKDQ